MTYQEITFKLEGVSGLVMHNSRLACPIDPVVKEMKKITGKRKKTDDDIQAISDLEWQGGLYLNEKLQPCIPGENIEAMLVVAAKSQKLGKQFKAAIIVEGSPALVYPKPRKIEELQADPNHRLVKMMTVQQSKVMRCRPFFPVWSITVVVKYHPEMLDREKVIELMQYAGSFVGLGDSRPRYGRFSVSVMN